MHPVQAVLAVSLAVQAEPVFQEALAVTVHVAQLADQAMPDDQVVQAQLADQVQQVQPVEMVDQVAVVAPVMQAQWVLRELTVSILETLQFRQPFV